jgi:transcriptional regulator with XRE-family HTH domain
MRSARTRRILATIGANVARLRKRRAWTQADLAGAIGANEIRVIQRVERAEINFGVVLLIELADALDAPISALLRPAKPEPARKGRPPAPRSKKRTQANST